MTKPPVWGRRSETARSPARPSLFRRKKELPDTITAAENWSVMETQAQQAPPSNWKAKIALFLTGQTISLFGSCLVQYAIVWYITLTTQSGIMMMISTLCVFLPQVLISLFSGVWADRYHRKRLIICADTLTAVSTLILAILFLAGQGSLWLIFLVSGIRSIGQGIQTPAVQAVIPLLVPQDKLMKVNGINGSVTSMMTLLSPAVSGWLMAVAPLGFIFLIDVITAVIGISILSVQRIPLHQKAREKQKGGYMDDLKAGLRYVKRSGFIRELLIFYAVFFFLLVPAAQMTPLQVTRTFGDDVWRLTLVEMLFSIGSVAGGVIIAAWGGFRNRIATIAFACSCFGFCTALLGIPLNFWVYLAVILVTGVFVPFFSSALTVLLQERIQSDMQGRIFSLLQIVVTAAMPLGMVLFGPLGDAIPIEVLLLATGLLLVLLGGGIYTHKALRRAGEPVIQEEPPTGESEAETE